MWNAHAESDRHRNKSLIEHLSESVEYVLSIVTAQGNYIACNAWNCTFLLSGLWLLAMVVFVNAYTGTLISYLTVPKLNPVINSLEQLVAETDWKLSIEKNSEFSKQILASQLLVNTKMKRCVICKLLYVLGCHFWSVQDDRRFLPTRPRLAHHRLLQAYGVGDFE